MDLFMGTLKIRMYNMNIKNFEKQAIIISENADIIKKFLLSEFYLIEKIKIIIMTGVAMVIMLLSFISENQESFAILLSLSLLSSLYYFSLKASHRECANIIRKCDSLLYDIMIYITVELRNNEAETLSEERLIEFQDRADELQWGIK